MYSTDVLMMETTAAVDSAARAFARALAESPAFGNFEQASDRLQADPVAAEARIAYYQKQQSLRALLMLNALSPAERQELEELRLAFFGQPAVVAMVQAQDELMSICRTAAGILSDRIGLPFASACGPGCAC
jgi:cell fate (sporulation/competence/biofilm development) regulator YlbF (YheA/YmcA/DUF963 family)